MDGGRKSGKAVVGVRSEEAAKTVVCGLGGAH